jgi:hypothetical protein
MFALLTLSRKLELVVARSVGVSAWQFLQPAALVAGVIGLISILIYNPVAAELKRKATALELRLFAAPARLNTAGYLAAPAQRRRPGDHPGRRRACPTATASPGRDLQLRCRMAASASASTRNRPCCIAATGN